MQSQDRRRISSGFKNVITWTCSTYCHVDGKIISIFPVSWKLRRFQWPHSIRVPAAARLLGLRVRIPPGAWIFVCCECRVLSGRGLCDELITRPEEAYQLYCVIVCVLETSKMRKPRPALGRCATKQLKFLLIKCNVIHVQSRIMRWAGRVTRML